MTKVELFLFTMILCLMVSCGDNDPFTSEFQLAPDTRVVDPTNEEAQVETIFPNIEVNGESVLTRIDVAGDGFLYDDSQATGEACDYTGNLIENGSFEKLDQRKGLLKNKSLVSFSNKRSWDVFSGLPGFSYK